MCYSFFLYLCLVLPTILFIIIKNDAVASEQSLTDRKTIPFRTANGNGSPIICFKTHFKEKCLYP